jgi:hypothetical protein
MQQSALVIREGSLRPRDQHICRVLEFFGIPWEVLTLDRLARPDAWQEKVQAQRYCILGPMSLMAQAIEGRNRAGAALPSIVRAADSVYLYSSEDIGACNRLLRFLANDPNAEIRRLEGTQTTVMVSGDNPDFCGPMSGLRLQVPLDSSSYAFRTSVRDERRQDLLSMAEGQLFFSLVKDEVRFFLNASCETIDIESSVEKGFYDIKEHFCSAVPLVMYLKWAFQEVVWRPQEIGACLIVDDPLLKPRYGFLDFNRTFELMKQYGFTTDIAFIPWNWRRTHQGIAELFKKHADTYSLSVHGCDHMGQEFGIESGTVLNEIIKVAKRRMQLHEQRTGVHHEWLMVFPQGVFSAEACQLLKYNNFLAAVNTEVSPLHCEKSETTIADVWDIAIMKYGSFPIFTRRYSSHGLENFAFDMLLGKPCLIAAHHEFFRNNGREVIEFIESLNSLRCPLRWRPLSAVIKRSFRQRIDGEGNAYLQMYGNQLTIENPTSRTRVFHIEKRENDATNIHGIEHNLSSVGWKQDASRVRFIVEVPSKEHTTIIISYKDVFGEIVPVDSTGKRIKTSLRRYLSEFRDDYMCRNAFVYNSADKLKRYIASH